MGGKEGVEKGGKVGRKEEVEGLGDVEEEGGGDSGMGCGLFGLEDGKSGWGGDEEWMGW